MRLHSGMSSAKPSTPEAPERTLCAMKLRVYPTGPQAGRLGHWLYCAHRFRNEAAAWLQDWRKQRAIWFANNPFAKELKGEALNAVLPPHLAGHPINACSSWLTARLQQARTAVPRELGLPAEERSMRVIGEAVHTRLKSLTRPERDELTDAWLLTVPRTVFDQVLQDLKKTWSKALKDRKDKRKKPAGFPKPRKFSYGMSIRVQLAADKNQAVRDHWAQGRVFIPGLGKLDFRDSGYVLPKTPPSLFTLGRDAAGRIHATFVCVEGEGPWAGDGSLKRKGRLERKRLREQGQGVLVGGYAPLPVDSETGLPTIDAVDLGLTGSSSNHVRTEVRTGAALETLRQAGALPQQKAVPADLRVQALAENQARSGSNVYQGHVPTRCLAQRTSSGTGQEQCHSLPGNSVPGVPDEEPVLGRVGRRRGLGQVPGKAGTRGR